MNYKSFIKLSGDLTQIQSLFSNMKINFSKYEPLIKSLSETLHDETFDNTQKKNIFNKSILDADWNTEDLADNTDSLNMTINSTLNTSTNSNTIELIKDMNVKANTCFIFKI